MTVDAKRVLIIGSGGREHALLRACLRSPLAGEVIVAPGNGGMAQETETVDIDITDPGAVLNLVKSRKIDFVIVGPEGPLSIGLVDHLERSGVTVFGTSRAATQLEASKAYCKEFLRRHNIPTAAYATFSNVSSALDYLRSQTLPVVIKASGLAAGKGVIIASTEAEAEEAVRGMLSGSLFGESGREIVIEEFMEGEEASIMLMVCRERYVSLPASQDHKRVGEGDSGLNTGGMGAYAPASVVTQEIHDQIRSRIIAPTLRGLADEGIDYRGVLYIGIMITTEGPRVVEFNTRFGDPETQVLLPLCQSDPVAVMYACARGTLDFEELELFPGYAMVVVLAARGYPGSFPKGDVIKIPDGLPANVAVLHAGTTLDSQGNVLSSGGRVLGVVARADTLEKAAVDAYAVCDEIAWNSKYFRRDIGARELKRNNPEA